MPDKQEERVESIFQSTLSMVERLTGIRARLSQTDGMDFDLSVINDGIKLAIQELGSSAKERDWNSVGETTLLGEVERMVEFRKILVESDFPHGSELQGLKDVINLTIRRIHWQ